MRSTTFLALLSISIVSASVLPTPRPAKRQGDLLGNIIDKGISGATDLLGDATSALDNALDDVTSAINAGVTDATSLFGVVTSKVAEEFTENTSVFGQITSKLDSLVDEVPITKVESWLTSATGAAGSKIASITSSPHTSPSPTHTASTTPSASISQVSLNNNQNSDSAGYVLGVDNRLIVLGLGAVLAAVAL
ncbi:hypothetical protein I302_107037 [Kwoniella bestiolae CBS 10118]|uniref:Cell wall protein n=1 Tax=Kwoniella bestiolae CBS 10118 TaxID=1296100 RepID=A0A1B9FZQ4_9TREE|nr:hypothetical protein I302_05698 [Kwoniella bestiolae CBS 10118]OCF24239.1 hypothetical protein I302_05698 [Kwoniella bestiolae CBS 10118]